MAQIRDPNPAGPTNRVQLAEFEKYIGFPLPDDYSDFLLQNNGGHPDPDAFLLSTDLGVQEDVVMCFFPMRDLHLGNVEVKRIEQLRSWPLHCAWDDLQNDLRNLYEIELNDPLLPIGTDGSSNYFCVVLSGPRVGSIVFLDHETAEEHPLAQSFSAFLTSLRPRERTDYGAHLTASSWEIPPQSPRR